MKYTITIPEPCHEDWGDMTTTEKGKFCDSCKKEVIDFSNSSMAMLSQKLDAGSKLCGRFRPDQLNRSIRSSKGNAIRQRGVLVAAVALLAGISPVVAQSNAEPIKIEVGRHLVGKIAVHTAQEQATLGKEIVTLTGTVRSGQSLLSGADVRIKGTHIKTNTDAEGKFEISVKAATLSPFLVLQVSYFDFEPREVVVRHADSPIDIDLIYNGFIMGDISIEEDPNVIDRVKGVFRKKGE